jgi:hypothetical protein
MKNLEMNELETIVAGRAEPSKHSKCLVEMGMGAITGGLFFGPVGYFAGMALGYYTSKHCH